ncbi:hypothetical protein Vretifemale_20418 [Volvox reticuliferus]|uniref:RCC1-like domain-containing protein n=1 Tax=Volvox reticuliferus TaxID=1737510 RepID=A0A8J4CZQ6_9CHLO|nr:hypothetical protein Vretifemale_20418 [Volvox reticuliferus]
MSLPSFTANGVPITGMASAVAAPHTSESSAAAAPVPTRNSSIRNSSMGNGLTLEVAAQQQRPSLQSSLQGSSALSHTGSESTFQWGKLDFGQQQQPKQQQQEQQYIQLLQQQQQQFGGLSNSQACQTNGSIARGVSPSESMGSLTQYGTSSSAGQLMLAGPGSLCAVLPYYARRPPIEAVVFGWGVNEDGQLGLALARENVVVPKVVEALLGLQFSGRSFSRTPLVAGSRNTLALDAAGQVWSFGWNDRGTLGHGHRDQETKPKRIAALKGTRIVQVAMGGWHSLALSDRGAVFAWGGNEYGQCGNVLPGQRDITEPMLVDLGLGPNQRVKQISAGGMHSLALLEDGTVWQWGENWGDFSMRPVRTPRPVPGAVSVAAIACGAFHNLALTVGGRVLSWGMNDYGQLGNGSTTYATAPRPVLDMDGVVVADIAAGGWHSCALSSAGEVWVWGRGEYGRLGLGDRSGSSKLRPQKVRGLEAHVVVQVAAGGSHTLALTSTARLFVWGRGAFGRLGLGDPERDCYHPVECPLPGGTERWRVAAIGAGGRHSICLAIPVRDTPPPGWLEEDDVMMTSRGPSMAAMGGMPMGSQSQLATPGAFGSVLPQHLQSMQLHRIGSEEYDRFSEPSLYDRAAVPGGPSSVRTRRATGATADGSGTADGSITAASSVVAAAAGSSCSGGIPASAYPGGSGGNCTATGGAMQTQLHAAPPPPLDLQPSKPSTLTDWPSVDSSGVALSADSVSIAAPPPTPADPPSPPPSSTASGSMTTSTSPFPPLLLRPASVSSPPRGPVLLTAPTAAADPPPGPPPIESPRALSRPKSPLRLPSPALVALPPTMSYGIRRSASAVGALSHLTQLLPEPAAVAAAAVLDADSDLAPPWGLAAAAAAAVAFSTAAAASAGPSSVYGGSAGGGCGSRTGSVTGMARYRTVFGGGGEEEDEATQAAEAAEAAADENDGSGTSEEDQRGDLNAQDDTDEDQVYDGSVVQHPRSPSLLSRPRSPPVPLSPRRHGSFAAHVGVGSSRSASPALMTGGSGGGGGGGGAASGSPSSRSLLSSYGSPRMPSSFLPQ